MSFLQPQIGILEMYGEKITYISFMHPGHHESHHQRVIQFVLKHPCLHFEPVTHSIKVSIATTDCYLHYSFEIVRYAGSHFWHKPSIYSGLRLALRCILVAHIMS